MWDVNMMLTIIAVFGGVILGSWFVQWAKTIYVKTSLIWYDLWIGFYYNKQKKILYFCPFPTIVFVFSKSPI